MYGWLQILILCEKYTVLWWEDAFYASKYKNENIVKNILLLFVNSACKT